MVTKKRFSDKKNKFFLIVISVVFVPVCFGVLSSYAAEPLNIYVVNYPLKYFAERIGGKHVSVVFPAPEDVDPAYWNPDIASISAYQQADLVLLNGANYAKWVRKVSLPRSRMVDTSAKFKDRYITADEIVTHSHGAEGEHAHESLAFTTWLDLDLAAQQAKSITKVLSHKNPGMKDFFKKNYEALENDLLALDLQIKAIVAKHSSKPLLASHPVYDYFERRYGLNIKSVHWEPGIVPNDEQWMKLHGILKNHPAQWMIWEGKPADESVKKLKSAGVNGLIFNPCGNTPEKGDFISVLQKNVANLRMAFE
ncbi:MAG: metal ABC transporter substrate-binding protein [Desulfobacterales bacterium]|jgi:zinc transport system substrate-binding protein